jgi:hypothetical protein
MAVICALEMDQRYERYKELQKNIDEKLSNEDKG